MRVPPPATVRPASTNGWRRGAHPASSSTRRTASTAKPAISRTRIRILPGLRPRAAAGRTIRICEWNLEHKPYANLAPVPDDPRDVSRPGRRASRCCPYRGIQRRWTCPIGAGIAGAVPTRPFCHSGARGGRSSARWSRRAVISSPPLRRAAVAALAALAITWPGMVSAWAQSQPRDAFSRTSPSGSYLAARHAGGQRDAAAAASYYRAALRGDPRNNELLGRTFLAVLANGEVDEGVRLAERVLQVDKNDRIARLVLGVRAIKQKQYPVARRELAQSIRGPITDLAATLLSAWTMANSSEAKRV